MKKKRILQPEPKSKFYRIKCSQCGEEQTVFSHSTFEVRCLKCGNILAQPTGGHAKILGETIKVL